MAIRKLAEVMAASDAKLFAKYEDTKIGKNSKLNGTDKRIPQETSEKAEYRNFSNKETEEC